MQKKCENCGIDFEAKRATAHYCSTRCRTSHHRNKGTPAYECQHLTVQRDAMLLMHTDSCRANPQEALNWVIDQYIRFKHPGLRYLPPNEWAANGIVTETPAQPEPLPHISPVHFRFNDPLHIEPPDPQGIPPHYFDGHKFVFSANDKTLDALRKFNNSPDPQYVLAAVVDQDNRIWMVGAHPPRPQMPDTTGMRIRDKVATTDEFNRQLERWEALYGEKKDTEDGAEGDGDAQQ